MIWTGEYSSNGDFNDNETSIGLESKEEYTNEAESNLTLIPWITLPITVVLGITIAYSRREKDCSRKLRSLSKSNSVKFSGVLLCLLIILTMIPMTIMVPTVNADTYVMPLYGSTWMVESGEESKARSVVNSMEYYFSTYAGYTTYDLFGSNTQKQTVLDHASAFEDNFDHVAMFHYGHAGWDKYGGIYHYDYFDDDGPYDFNNQIWDYEIYPEVSQSKHFFVILWSCRQGNTEGNYHYGYGARGMPYAWHYGYLTSSDCFIGFKDASVPLSQQSEDNPSITYDLWLFYVMFYLAVNHYTVIQALNQVSIWLLGCEYYETELHQGFYAEWPYFDDDWGWMKIYGNPNIRVY